MVGPDYRVKSRDMARDDTVKAKTLIAFMSLKVLRATGSELSFKYNGNMAN